MVDSISWQIRGRSLSLGDPALVMGIVNVTPDSFSDGGRYLDSNAAVEHAMGLVNEGADVLDIGGESSRPGAEPVSEAEELARVVPVISELSSRTTVPISIDTYKAAVAQAAIKAGAHIINDISGLQGDPDMSRVAAESRAGVIVMHMQGTPQTMQVNPTYSDVVGEVAQFFEARLQALREAGIAGDRVVLDPGIGFGKTAAQNLDLLANLEEFRRFGRPICLGVSRKGFFGKLLGRPTENRLAASLAAASYAVTRNPAHLIRVHDVAATRDTVRLLQVLATYRASRMPERPGKD
jgi:dihydropteroate synthase